MMSQRTLVEQVKATPLLFIASNTITPPLDSLGGMLAASLATEAETAFYGGDPDGWQVPLSALMQRTDAVADFLLFETKHQNDFEIFGGVDIHSVGGVSVGLVWYRFIEDVIKAIGNINQKNGSQRIPISNDYFILAEYDGETIHISNGHLAKKIPERQFRTPLSELLRELKVAYRDVVEFEKRLEPLLITPPDSSITREQVKWFFGLA